MHGLPVPGGFQQQVCGAQPTRQAGTHSQDGMQSSRQSRAAPHPAQKTRDTKPEKRAPAP